MEADERFVEEWLREKSLRVERFSKQERRRSKTPEFRVLRGEVLAFFCEVKSMREDERLDNALAAAPPGSIVEVCGPDSTFNAVENKIHEAVRQFDAVNPELEYPNVLVVVNHDRARDVGDLCAVVEGDFVAEDGTRHAIYREFSEGRIRYEKLRIAVYVWIERRAGDAFVRWYDCVRDRYPVLAEVFPVAREKIA